MKQRISRVVLVLALGVITTTLTAPAAYAGPGWFKYPGITCGPDMRAVIGTVTTGNGYINIEYAYGDPAPDGGIAFGYAHYTTTGSHKTIVPSRYLNSYDYALGGSAKLVSRGVSCL